MPDSPSLDSTTASDVPRPRRSCLAVPGSNPRFLHKAKGLDADQVFLDLEDACAPSAKPGARKNIVAALTDGGWGNKIRAVRVNDWTTKWTYQDVIEVVEGAGADLDCIMLPKVQTPEHIVALDLLLTQIETEHGLEVGRIGIEAQIENALGLINVNAIAAASPRVETIIFGPADFMASINMKSLVVGEQPPGYDVGDAYHHILMSILMGRGHMTNRRSTARTCRSVTPMGSAASPAGPQRWVSTVSGRCTPTRSTSPMTCSARGRRTTTTPRASSTRTTGTPPTPEARRGPRCSVMR